MGSPKLKNFNADLSESRPTGASSTDRQASVAADTISERLAVLSGRFEPLKQIGGYGKAAFYLVRDRRADAAADEVVKLKVFTGHTESDARLLELFRLEARAAARLSHPNIIKASSPEEIQGVHFAVVEHPADATTLKELLDREAWLDLKVAIAIIHQMADALDYAHRLGVLHLRIQPESILLDADGTARLTDFGLEANDELAWAHRVRSRHSPAHYLSPEQVSGWPVDARSDLYSLGIVFYKMLTDRLPFDAEDLGAVKQMHLTRSPLPPHLYSTDLPLWVSTVITRLLEKDPARRFQDVAAFRTALAAPASPHIDIIQPGDGSSESDKPTHKEAQPAVTTAAPAQAVTRAPWEPPSITALNVEIDEPTSAEPSVAIAPANQFRQSDAGEQVEARPIPFANRAERLTTTRARKKAWQIRALIIALSLVAVGELIAIVRADRAQRMLPVQPVSTAPEEQNDSNSRSPGEPSTPEVASPPATSVQPPAVNQPRLQPRHFTAVRPARVSRTRATGTAARMSRQRSLQPSSSRRYRPVKRMGTRVRRYGLK
jgi:serine/threonine protein kinase